MFIKKTCYLLSPIFLMSSALMATDIVNGVIFPKQTETATIDPKGNPNASGLTKEFYEKFWKIDPSIKIPEIVYKDSADQSFYQQVIIKSLTGYGTGADESEDNKGLYQEIEGVFSCYLPTQSCSYRVNRPDQVNRVNQAKILLAALEQCYANNSIVKKAGLENIFGIRYQTKLENSLGVMCDKTSTDEILRQSYAFLGKDYDAPSNDSSISDLEGFYKSRFSIIHSSLTIALDAEIAKLIISINSNYSGQESMKTFIDKYSIAEPEANKIFNAYTDVISANVTSFPLTIFNRLPDEIDGKILSNGNIISVDADKASQVKNYRKMRAEKLKTLSKEYVEKSRSFGILKQAAISGIASIVNERYADKKTKKSQLDALHDLINKAMKNESKKDEKVEPSVILKQIRDQLALNNQLSFKRYIALERAQLALATSQMSRMQVLAERINKGIGVLYNNAVMFDAGDQMTGQIGQKPDIKELK